MEKLKTFYNGLIEKHGKRKVYILTAIVVIVLIGLITQ
jgi:hypothetical protein